MIKIKRLNLLFLLTFLPACAGDLVQRADLMAAPTGLNRSQVKTDTFLLTTYSKITNPSQPFDMYIEGDGLAWLSAYQPSMNPTPRKALALALAIRDPAANVIYIARPCQFTPLDLDTQCDVDYWTGKRFAEEVIASVNQAIDKTLAGYDHPQINLIGYSGGGAVAVLVSARRTDVASIRTVAGNLDHAEVNRVNEVSQMKGSLNAIDQAKQVAKIPQLHFSGGEDEIISPLIAQRFWEASQPTTCIKMKTIPEASHEDGWLEIWPDLLKLPVDCQTPES